MLSPQIKAGPKRTGVGEGSLPVRKLEGLVQRSGRRTGRREAKVLHGRLNGSEAHLVADSRAHLAVCDF